MGTKVESIIIPTQKINGSFVVELRAREAKGGVGGEVGHSAHTGMTSSSMDTKLLYLNWIIYVLTISVHLGMDLWPFEWKKDSGTLDVT